jgi:hypothetical protein
VEDIFEGEPVGVEEIFEGDAVRVVDIVEVGVGSFFIGDTVGVKDGFEVDDLIGAREGLQSFSCNVVDSISVADPD